MKELSIEEKLQEAKRLYETANADQRYVLESIFPELKESEDEKIRKRLIGHLRGCRNQCCSEVMIREYAEWIAWLEKQGDKDKLIKELGAYKVKYTQEILGQQLEKQGGQKAVEMVAPKFKVGD